MRFPSQNRWGPDARQAVLERLEAGLDANPAQGRFIREDRSRSLALLTPRQTGKSWSIIRRAYRQCLRYEQANYMILCDSAPAAEAIYLEDFRQQADLLGLPVEINYRKLQFSFPWGAKVTLGGCADSKEINKLRGRRFSELAVDEVQNISERRLSAVLAVVRPAMLKHAGTLVYAGTPGPIPEGQLWEITTFQPPAKCKGARHLAVPAWEPLPASFNWLVHRWTLRDNPAVTPDGRTLWQVALEDKEKNGWDDSNPTWRREYLGEWVADPDALVCVYARLRDGRADLVAADGPHGLPAGHEWRYVLGVDLGYTEKNPCGLVVVAYAPTHGAIHVIHEHREAGLTVDDIEALAARMARDLQVSFDDRVIDSGGGGSAIVAASLAQRWGVSFRPADKAKRAEYIQLLNSDMMSGRVKIRPDSQLAEELRLLQWKDRAGGETDKRTPDHLFDALLYTWRYLYVSGRTRPAAAKAAEVRAPVEDPQKIAALCPREPAIGKWHSRWMNSRPTRR